MSTIVRATRPWKKDQMSRKRCIMRIRGQSSLDTDEPRFKRETEMAAPVIRWLQRRGLRVKPEFSVPWGICDLVGVKLDPVRVRRRLSYGQTRPIGPLIRLQILSRIPEADSGKSITLEKLKRELSDHLPSDFLSRELDLLVRGNFVTSPRSNFFQKANGWAPLHVRIVAVELKLTRVSEALSQAASNRAFATDSYVALPGKLALRIERGDRADIFRRTGLGLLAVWHQACRELVRPSGNKAACSKIIQSHVVERFWRTRDN
jgi:hypothetical protein